MANPIRLQARLMAAALARQRATIMRRLSLVPAAPLAAALPSIFDPIYVGINEFGLIVLLTLMYRNILIGGEPGSGKSALLNNIVAHAALSLDCRLCLLDGKLVELGLWRRCADVFVGPDLDAAIRTLRKLQTVINNRYAYLTYCERRKITPADVFAAILVAIDEIAYFSATVGDKKQQDQFVALLRDIVARGRAVGVMVAGATQRPSSDIILPSLRDLHAWRFAGRTTNDVSSDIVLGHGWAGQGYSANTIATDNPGAGFLIAEGGIPALVKTAFLGDDDIKRIASYAAWLRRTQPITTLPGARLRAMAPTD